MEEGRWIVPKLQWHVKKDDVQKAKEVFNDLITEVETVEFVQLLTELRMLDLLKWDLSNDDEELSLVGATDMQWVAIARSLWAMLRGGRVLEPVA